KPIFACRDAKFRRFLHRYVPVVNEKFWPTLWCFEARIMTIVRAVIQSVPEITYTSDILTLPDGGQVILHWEENENSIYSDSKTRPTVLLLPGLTGCSRQSYILHLVKQAKDKGYRCVVFNNRGIGGKKLLTPRSYCAANVEDLTNVINHIKGKYPDAPLIAAGISMGGMLVFNYIAKMGRDCPLLAGMTISVAFNVFESTKSLEQPLNHLLFNRTLTSSLREAIKENFQVLSEKFDLEHVLKSSTIREFDDRLTSKMFGYKDWQEYYKDATLHDKCHHIQVPLLCLNAADDPFSPLYD
ncbi:protein ABHD1-like, partial [Lingula anatina]|uniref:Phospholipase ABHD3 n=1 Tax=Lingula anatina TaxID=7574 RepID=A0A2R2MJZ0_LINAN